MQPTAVLETVIYAVDLGAAERFYADVLGLVPFSKLEGRQLFYRLGDQVLLVFNPEATERPPAPGALPVPPHGSRGAGHVCFKATGRELERWREHLEAKGVAIDSDFVWPASGGRSIYFRDPAGNSIELAEPRIWGLQQ